VACIVEERQFDEQLAEQRAGEGDDDSDDADAADDDGDSDDDTDDEPPPSELCQDYCDQAMKNCTDEFALYASPEACLALCAYLPEGDDDDGNNVACRLRQARLAGTTGEPDVHCPAAGPGGNDQNTRVGCGGNCESYCMLHPKICTRIPDELILDTGECRRRCAALPNDKHFDVVYHHDGDNVQCRLVHLSSAAISLDSAEVHCWHARMTPGVDSPCGNTDEFEPSCEQYCDLVMVSCTDELAVYDTKEQCLSACPLLPKGKSSDTVENTLGCRRYHAYSALDAPEVHCPHASAAGDGHCGLDNCEVYCPLAKAACGDEYDAAFDSDEDCLDECAKVDGAEADSNYRVDPPPRGDNVQCRIYHTVLAAGDAEACVSALGGGDCQ